MHKSIDNIYKHEQQTLQLIIITECNNVSHDISIEMALPCDISLQRKTLAQLFLIRMLQMFCRLDMSDPIQTIYMNYSQVQLPLSDREAINLSMYLHHSLLSLSSVSSACLCAVASS